MSAIFGIMRFDGGEVSSHELENMGRALAHRGPDGRKFVLDGAVGLGHCLMRVNNEDVFEAQPLRDSEGDLTLVADCRIDNRGELAAAFGLSAADISDMPDSAFILRAYKKWGERCPEHLLGDFAFAIWDGRAKKLVLARDHTGQRSIQYHHGKDFFAFATEARALWAVKSVPRTLSEEMIGRHLLIAPSLTSNRTLHEGICFVLGGSTYVVHRDGSVAGRRYWEPHADPAWLDRQEDDYVERFRSVLGEAVECRIRRLIAPPALCFSAGFDSTAIAGLSGPVLAAQGRKLIAISSVMAEDYTGPLPHARRWVECCRRDMPHLDMQYFVRTNESDFDNLEDLFARVDDMASPGQAITDILLRQGSTAGARLMMDGLGGDNTLNPRGRGFLRYLFSSAQFNRFLFELRAHSRLEGRSRREIFWNEIVVGLAPSWLHQAWRRMRNRSDPFWAGLPLKPGFVATLLEEGKISPADLLLAPRPYESRRTALERTTRIWPAKAHHDHANLAASRGLDITRPMLDKRVVEFGYAIPESLYVKNGRDRYLARRALADIYPPEFQTRRSTQDPRDPDYLAMLLAALPVLQRDIEELAKNETLRDYFDFTNMNGTIDALHHRPKSSPALLHALRSYYAAKYLTWFQTKPQS